MTITARVAGVDVLHSGRDRGHGARRPVHRCGPCERQHHLQGGRSGALSVDSVWKPAVAEHTVDVSARVTVRLSGQSARAGRVWLYPLGHKVRVRGVVTPSHALLGDGSTPGRVTLLTYKKSGSSRWVRAGTSTVKLSASSRFSTSLRPKVRGSYRLRVILPADTDHTGGTSVYRYFKLY